MATGHDPERRRYPRVKTTIPVEITCAGMAPMRTAISDISLCGCYIETMFTLDLGTKVELVFSVNEETIRATAVIATRHPQVGNGMDFIDMTPEGRFKLGKYIAQREPEGA